MKTVVFAYHDMGLTGLEALQRAGFEIAAIFSHEDDPGENCWFGSVPDWAIKNNIPLFCLEDVNTDAWFRKIASLAPDVIFSFYYRHLLSQEILAIPPTGAFNLHGSFLPYYRGRCPVNWVLVNGEKETGVTLHRMVEKADAGDIVAQKAVAIDFVDTAYTLYKKLCRQAALLLDEILPMIKNGTAPRIQQDLNSGSYFGRRTPEDGLIDWHWPALRIYNLIRAVAAPYPGTFTFTKSGAKMHIWRALPEEGGMEGKPGRINMKGGYVLVTAGDGGMIRLLDIEIYGKHLKYDDIWRYFSDKEGEALP